MGLIDHVRVWFRPEGGDWREVDRICLTHYEVSTVTGIEKTDRGAFHSIRPRASGALLARSRSGHATPIAVRIRPTRH